MSQGLRCYRFALVLLTAAAACPAVGLATPGVERLPPVVDSAEPSPLGDLHDEQSLRAIAEAEPADGDGTSILPAAYLQPGAASSRRGICWDLDGLSLIHI